MQNLTQAKRQKDMFDKIVARKMWQLFVVK